MGIIVMRVLVFLAVALVCVSAQEKKKVVTECIEPEMKTKAPTKVAAQTEKEVEQLVKEVNEKVVKLNKERAKIRDIEPEQLSLDELKDRFSKDLVKKFTRVCCKKSSTQGMETTWTATPCSRNF